MFEFLYEWIQNIAFYMVLTTVLIQVLPGDTYKKYIRFFTGMILILLLLTPVLRILGMENSLGVLFNNEEYERERKRIESSTDYLNEVDIESYVKKVEEMQNESE